MIANFPMLSPILYVFSTTTEMRNRLMIGTCKRHIYRSPDVDG
jgi:hypothetical protein